MDRDIAGLAQYHREKAHAIEGARRATDRFRMVVAAVVGDPIFDALPEMLAVASPKTEMRFLLLQNPDFVGRPQNSSVVNKVIELAEKRGRTRIRLVGQQNYPALLLNWVDLEFNP